MDGNLFCKKNRASRRNNLDYVIIALSPATILNGTYYRYLAVFQTNHDVSNRERVELWVLDVPKHPAPEHGRTRQTGPKERIPYFFSSSCQTIYNDPHGLGFNRGASNSAPFPLGANEPVCWKDVNRNASNYFRQTLKSMSC